MGCVHILAWYAALGADPRMRASDLFPPLEELPPRFWEMIIKHCPNLEELAICSFSSSSRVFDFEPALDGSWPHLHTLTLGSFGYQSDFLLGPVDPHALGDFLTSHTSIKYIRFLWNFKRWMSPEMIQMHLGKSALPALDTYIGVYQQLAELPHPESVETLDLTCEPMYQSRLHAVCPVLARLTSLTSLDIWTHVAHPSRDNTNVYRTLIESVPKLTDFHFMCTTGFPAVSASIIVYLFHAHEILETTQTTDWTTLSPPRPPTILSHKGSYLPR